jgi:hypothetical protein
MVRRRVILVLLAALLAMPWGRQNPQFSAEDVTHFRHDRDASSDENPRVPFRLTDRHAGEFGVVRGDESIEAREKLREASLIRNCTIRPATARSRAADQRRDAGLDRRLSGRNRPLQV